MTFEEWQLKYLKSETQNPAQNLFLAFDRWLMKTPKAWKMYGDFIHKNGELELFDVFRILESNGVEFPTHKKDTENA